jgi:glycosyltransferase involved in cell wall biosynthesis
MTKQTYKGAMPKILMISPYPIWPPDTGAKIRVYELAHGISEKGITVTVVMPASPGQYHKKKVNQYLTLDVIYYPHIIPFLFTNRPFSYMYLISLHPWYRLFLQKYIANHDIIQFEQASFGDIVDYIPNSKTVIYNAHNMEADYVASENRSRWINGISTRRISRLENKIVQRSDHILTCSEMDAQRISDLYKKRKKYFKVIHNGIHVDRACYRFGRKDIEKFFPGILHFQSIAIFSGSDVEHNRSAVRFIIESIASKLSHECAFILKGQCSRRFRNNKIKNVFIDPSPGNVGPYANICTVALNPIFDGSGTSLKVLDYLANGLPVISTEFGMRGYEDLRPFVTISDANSFAEKILKNPAFLPTTRNAVKKYTWESAIKMLKDIYLA